MQKVTPLFIDKEKQQCKVHYSESLSTKRGILDWNTLSRSGWNVLRGLLNCSAHNGRRATFDIIVEKKASNTVLDKLVHKSNSLRSTFKSRGEPGRVLKKFYSSAGVAVVHGSKQMRELGLLWRSNVLAHVDDAVHGDVRVGLNQTLTQGQRKSVKQMFDLMNTLFKSYSSFANNHS